MPSKMQNKDMADDIQSSEGLVLYHGYGSSYSQRVLMMLYEKELNFDSCLIDLYVGEHLEPFFINLNPKAEVPVLLNGKEVITESAHILDYLEDKFSDGDYHRLMPPKDTEEFVRVTKMRKLLEQIPMSVITFGTVYHSQLTVKPKMSDMEKQLRLSGMKCVSSLVDSFIIKHPEYEEKYREKKAKFINFFSSIQDVHFVKEALKKVEKVLDVIEEELSKNEDGWWFCGPNFSIADILLAILLHRIEFLGLSTWFFHDGVRPNLVKYYERVQHRESFVETFKFGYADDDLPGSFLSYSSLFVALGLIVFAIVAACAHLKNH